MTRNHSRKAEIHAYQEATGLPYLEASRQLAAMPSLTQVLNEHPLLADYDMGYLTESGRTRQERLARLEAVL